MPIPRIEEALVMGGHDDCGAEAVNRPKQLIDITASGFVKIAGWLVGKKNFRLGDDGSGDGGTLKFTARKLDGEELAFIRNTNKL